MRKIRILLLMMITLSALWAVGVQAQEAIGITAGPLNVRSAPNGERIGGLEKGVEFIIEGRNAAGDWVLGHTRDGALRGWVASEFLNRNFEIPNLPVTEEIVGASAAPPAEEQAAPSQDQPPAPEGSITGVTQGDLNLRNAPNGQVITTLPAQTTLVIEGRNSIGDWIKVHTPDNAFVGWVASRYVTLTGVTVQGLPVVGVSAIVSSDGNTTVYTVPGNEPAASAIEPGAAVISSASIQTARNIYARGRALGNRANVFTIVGDSITSEQPFMEGFAYSPYDLGAYGYLQDTINFFSVPPREGIPNSFANPSLSASAAFNAAAVLDIIWGDPNLCEPNEAPLLCEYRVVKPSVAVIMLGSIDVRLYPPDVFEEYYRRIIELTVDQGVIPVLTTFPNGDQYYPEESAIFNDIIRGIAAEQALPLIELRAPLMALPNRGVGDDQYHLSQDGDAYLFTGNEQRVGVTMRNLLTLQALDTLMRNVLG